VRASVGDATMSASPRWKPRSDTSYAAAARRSHAARDSPSSLRSPSHLRRG
jgi:hypothetical protein